MRERRAIENETRENVHPDKQNEEESSRTEDAEDWLRSEVECYEVVRKDEQHTRREAAKDAAPETRGGLRKELEDENEHKRDTQEPDDLGKERHLANPKPCEKSLRPDDEDEVEL